MVEPDDRGWDSRSGVAAAAVAEQPIYDPLVTASGEESGDGQSQDLRRNIHG